MDNILLIDDNTEEYIIIKHFFKTAGYDNELIHIDNGLEAIEYMRNTSCLPKLILLDLNLNEMTGHDVLKEISTITKTHNIPTFVLTGSHDKKEALKCYGEGADLFITKPLFVNKQSSLVKDNLL